jgi:hypothetical protein
MSVYFTQNIKLVPQKFYFIDLNDFKALVDAGATA